MMLESNVCGENSFLFIHTTWIGNDLLKIRKTNRAELILKIAYSSTITLLAILKTRSARRLARCLLPTFLCALKERRLGTRQRKLTFDVRFTNILTPNVASFNAECNIFLTRNGTAQKVTIQLLTIKRNPEQGRSGV